LFGAGAIGRAYFIGWKRKKLTDVVLWVDNTPPSVEMFGMKPIAPTKIAQTDFDYIVCAVQGEQAANSIRCQLVTMGIQEERILWSNPIDVWKEFFVG